MNGGVEACWRVAEFLGPPEQPSAGHIVGLYLARQLRKMIAAATQWLEDLRVTPPFALMLTASGVRDQHIVYKAGSGPIAGQVGLDRECVPVLPAMIETYEAEGSAAKAALDTLWLAAGWNDCPHVSEFGELQEPLK